MPLRFRVLPTDDARPGAGAAGPLVERELAVSDDLSEIRIGRRGDLELPLPFAVLSGVHARLARTGADGGWTIEDVGSTNGTWLDGARLGPGERRPIAPGADLRLGTLRLCFDGVAAASPSAAGTATIARRLVDDLFGEAPESAPAIRVVAGAPAAALRLVTAGRVYVVGRAETSALALPVDAVSREHAAFVRRPEGVLVRDLGSKNGVLVRGARVHGEHALTDGDTITIGPVTLSLEDPVTRYLAELAALPADEAPPAVAEPPAAAPPPPSSSPVEPAVAEPAQPRKPPTPRLATAVAISTLVLLVAATVALFLPAR